MYCMAKYIVKENNAFLNFDEDFGGHFKMAAILNFLVVNSDFMMLTNMKMYCMTKQIKKHTGLI